LQIFSRLRSSGYLSDLEKQAGRAIRLSLFTFVLGTSTFGLFMDFILPYINENVSFIQIELWIIMTFVWYLERHHGMHAQIYSTTNHIPFYIPISITGAINLLIIFFLIEPIGVWVFPVAHGISNLLINNWWNVYLSLKSLNTNFKSFFKEYVMGSLILLTMVNFFIIIMLK